MMHNTSMLKVIEAAIIMFECRQDIIHIVMINRTPLVDTVPVPIGKYFCL